MNIRILTTSDIADHVVADLNRLLPQLNPAARQLTTEIVSRVIAQSNCTVFVAEENGAIVGTAQLATYETLYNPYAWIEGVVVDSEQRGKGIASQLVQAVLDHAQELGYKEVNLTSNPRREAANHVYQKLGFELYDTNYYRYKLN